MELTPKITTFQFYTILFLSRVFALVTYMANLRTQLVATDEVIMSLFMAVFLFLTSIPTALFIKKDSSASIIMRASCVSVVFSKILCLIFLAESLYFGIITAVRFGIFTSSVMFPDTNVTFFIIMMLAASAYVAYKGIESMGRSAVIVLIPVILALVFVFTTQISDFDLLNFSSPFSADVGNIITVSFYSAARTGELAFITLLAPYVKNQKKSRMYLWLFAVMLIILVTDIMLVGILGNFGDTQLFSLYSLSVLAEFGFIERMDALITCIWLLCAVVKISLTIFLCETLLTSLFGKRRRTLYIAVSAVIVLAGAIPLSNDIINLAALIQSPIAAIFFITAVCVIPVAVMLGEKIKGAKREKT